MSVPLGQRKDWSRGARGLLTWCLPAAILIVSAMSGPRYQATLWPLILAFMGVACLLNARHCGRVHCYATGPFFLILAALALLQDLGAAPLGRDGWNRLSLILVLGSALLVCGSELLFGHYRPRGR